MSERVVITGMGAINPLGHNVEETWKNAVNGVSGTGPITLFNPEELSVQFACEVKNYDPHQFMSSRDARRRSRFEQFALIAASEALNQSGLPINEINSGRIGVIVSSAIGGIEALQEAILTIRDQGPRRVNPFAIPKLMANGAAGLIGIENQITGPSFSVASACASGIDGIGTAWLMIRAGLIDIALAGASEATITTIGMAAFDRLGAMSKRNDDYIASPKPFDIDRDGFVMGEGAAIIVLEKEDHAVARGADILCELAGYAATADAYHVTAPSKTGEGGAQAISLAMDSAGINPEEVDYINAHGTATLLNDATETLAIKSAFGDFAYKTPISSTKSMTGHMMGATGALEAILCVQTIRENLILPTINYQSPDPECDLDYVPNQVREAPVEIAVNNAFGFGGHNAVLVLRAYQ
ncbi:MAG: beta-ketoacyl-ACP synthase II [Anaerolineales bacterium]|jgi:beta-ketoacyl-acyl-carrier-protein synthase II